MTGFCRNMKHRPMKTVSEKVSPESNEKESFCSSSSIPLLIVKQFMIEMLHSFFSMMM